MTYKKRGGRVEEYAYYVNKLRQNVGLETWIWRQIVTSQRPLTTNKWPPYATEWTPPWKFSAYATGEDDRTRTYLQVTKNEANEAWKTLRRVLM